MAKTCHLYSGSKGNVIYIECGESVFLVDAGTNNKKICEGLSKIDKDPSLIDAIFITHEHVDHVNALNVFLKKQNIPLFSSEKIFEAMKENGKLPNFAVTNKIDNQSEIKIKDVVIIPFRLSHDSAECFGYRFNLPDGRSIGVCTDTGFVTFHAREVLKGCDMVYLESNHDLKMLKKSVKYSADLKRRILSDVGHLSNDLSAEFAVELVKNNTTRITLSHLSEENNTPALAKNVILNKLVEAGFKENYDFRLSVSLSQNEGKIVVL